MTRVLPPLPADVDTDAVKAAKMLAKMRMLEEGGSAFARKTLREVGDHGSDGASESLAGRPLQATRSTRAKAEGVTTVATRATIEALQLAMMACIHCMCRVIVTNGSPKPCIAGGFLHAGRLKTLSLLELVYDGFLAPQESSK